MTGKLISTVVFTFILTSFWQSGWAAASTSECEPSIATNHPVTAADISGALDAHQVWLSSINADKNDIESQFNLRKAISEKRDAGRVRLCGLNLVGSDFSNRNLLGVDFTGSDLRRSKFSGSHIGDVRFTNTCLADADLSHSEGFAAGFDGANLENANFSHSSLSVASFRKAKLIGTDFSEADISSSFMGGAIYSPKIDPLISIGGFQELDEITYFRDPLDFDDPMLPRCESTSPALLSHLPLLRLRKLLQDSGYRELERQATAAYERAYTRDEFNNIDISSRLDGLVRTVFLDYPSSYGECPSRALFFLFLSVIVFAPFYFLAIFPRPLPSRLRIYKLLPSDRVDSALSPILKDKKTIQNLENSLYHSAIYAIMFSAQSAFQIGWKDFNIGSWLTKLQTRDYTLVPIGWTRTLSGFQSLISLLLLATWALTYFGRPFG